MCPAIVSGIVTGNMHWVWHAGHAGREASCIEFGMPAMPGMKLA